MSSILRRFSQSTALVFVLLAVCASAISFAKFDHCRTTNWASPDSYVHACYSDIPTLLGDRGLNEHKWSYQGGEKAVEYPVVTGAIMWATSWLAPTGKNSYRGYFDVNALLLALIFIGAVLLVWRIRPQFAYLLPLSPAVIASLYINWDMWGIVSMLAAIYFFDHREYFKSSLVLGISIATKFFPVFLLLPIGVIFYRRGQLRELTKYLGSSFVVWLLINLPVILTTPSGWWHFYKLNLDRGADWGSIWYAISILGLDIKHLNNITLVVVLAAFAAVIVFLLETSHVPSLAEVSFIVLALMLCIGKVYSPQYVLWLTPLAVIALRERIHLPAFWIWQFGEFLYHIAIWQHLALVSGSKFGLPNAGYAAATLIRIAVTLLMLLTLARATLRGRADTEGEAAPDQKSRGQLADFLFGTASSYP